MLSDSLVMSFRVQMCLVIRMTKILILEAHHAFGTNLRNTSLRADLDGMIFPYDCSMRLAHVTSTTRIVSFKSDIQHLADSCTQHEKCRRILKHVLTYVSRSHNQNVRMTSCIRSLLDAIKQRAPQKSYRLNRP